MVVNSSEPMSLPKLNGGAAANSSTWRRRTIVVANSVPIPVMAPWPLLKARMLVMPVSVMLLLSVKALLAVMVRLSVPVAAPLSVMSAPLIVRAAAPKVTESPVSAMSPPDVAVLSTVMSAAIVNTPLAVTAKLATASLVKKVPPLLRRPSRMPSAAVRVMFAPLLKVRTVPATSSGPRVIWIVPLVNVRLPVPVAMLLLSVKVPPSVVMVKLRSFVLMLPAVIVITGAAKVMSPVPAKVTSLVPALIVMLTRESRTPLFNIIGSVCGASLVPRTIAPAPITVPHVTLS